MAEKLQLRVTGHPVETGALAGVAGRLSAHRIVVSGQEADGPLRAQVPLREAADQFAGLARVHLSIADPRLAGQVDVHQRLL